MFQLARLDHDSVVATLRAAGVDAFVGPTNGSGWTAIHSDDAADALLPTGAAIVDLASRRTPGADNHLLVLRVHEHGEVAELSWDFEGPGGDQTTGDTRDAARRLVGLFGTDHEVDEIEQLLSTGVEDEDQLVTSLAELLRLPDIVERLPERALVAVRADRSAVDIGAAVAGPSSVVDAGDGWWIVEPLGGGDSSWGLGIAVAAAVRRKDPVLLVAREGTEQRVLLMRRGGVDTEVAWARRWEETAPPDMSAEQYASLARRLGETEVPAHVRALLRRSSAPRGIEELLATFRVPSLVVDVLDGAPGTPEGRRIERQTWRKVVGASARDELQAVRRAWHEGTAADRQVSVRRCWVNVVAVATGFLLVGGVAVFALIVVLSDGSVVDDDSVTASDIAFVPFSIALAAWLGFLLSRAVVQLAGARRRARSAAH